MIIIKNNIIPFKGFKAINICGILFARKDAKLNGIDINHEKIHSKQCWELFIIGFYLVYLIEWILNIFKYGDSKIAYRLISFEVEACAHQAHLQYLKKRKWFAMWRN